MSEPDSGATAIVPGKPGDSELVTRIHDTDPDTIMSPPETNHVLNAEQKRLLERWIEAGAPYAPHWAYVVPQPYESPAVAATDWPANGIDRFVLARLEAEGLIRLTLEPQASSSPTRLRACPYPIAGRSR